MTLGLTIADNADGTGGVATITGSDLGSTNTLYRAPFSGATGPEAWTVIGTRVGDGTIALTGQGYFHWLVTGLVSAASAIAGAYQNLSNAVANQLPQRILDAVLTRVVGLNLSGIPSANIRQRWLPRLIDGVDPVPLIAICPAGMESFPAVLASKDDIGELVEVAVIDKQNGDIEANLARNENWRWQILSALRYQALAGVPEVNLCFPEPADKLDKAEWDANRYYGRLLFRFLTRTTRG